MEVSGASTCIDQDTIEVFIQNSPIVDLGNDIELCQGETTTLDAGTFISYLWSDGSTTQTIDVNTAGTYNVTITDDNGNTTEIIIPTSGFKF